MMSTLMICLYGATLAFIEGTVIESSDFPQLPQGFGTSFIENQNSTGWEQVRILDSNYDTFAFESYISEVNPKGTYQFVLHYWKNNDTTEIYQNQMFDDNTHVCYHAFEKGDIEGWSNLLYFHFIGSHYMFGDRCNAFIYNNSNDIDRVFDTSHFYQRESSLVPVFLDEKVLTRDTIFGLTSYNQSNYIPNPSYFQSYLQWDCKNVSAILEQDCNGRKGLWRKYSRCLA